MTGPSRLAFKAYEIEERIAVYFHRPAGLIIALAARAAGLSPMAVTIVAGATGIAGGALLADAALAPAGFGLIVLHGILDSSDGQLARMTGQTSELGRVLDGVAGYVTHIAIYAGIVAGWLSRGGSTAILPWAAAAGACNVIHAQMYDYYRGSYTWIAIDGRVPSSSTESTGSTGSASGGALLRAYEALQRRLAGEHPRVEAAIIARAPGGTVGPADRTAYRRACYRLVRGWNLLGDNTRFYSIGVLALLHHLEWFLVLVLLPMNVVYVAMWHRQRRADRRLLELLTA